MDRETRLLQEDFKGHQADLFLVPGRQSLDATIFVKRYQGDTIGQCFQTCGKKFNSPFWSHYLTEVGAYKGFCLVLPRGCNLDEIQVTISLNEEELSKYNLEVAKQSSKIRHVGDMTLIPLYFGNQNDCFRILREDQKMTISLTKKQTIDGPWFFESQLTWVYSPIGPWELDGFRTGISDSLEAYVRHFKQATLNYRDWKGIYNIRFVVFKTEGKYEKVKLNLPGWKTIEYDHTDCNILQPVSVNKKPFADPGWGAVYFCAEPDNLGQWTGGIVDPENFSLEISTSDPTHIWVFGIYPGRYSDGLFEFKKCPFRRARLV